MMRGGARRTTRQPLRGAIAGAVIAMAVSAIGGAGFVGATLVAAAVVEAAGASTAAAGTDPATREFQEDYERVPMPPGFEVVVSEFEGPVFADQHGRTLYDWPTHQLRNGPAGELKGKPNCDDTHYTKTAGLMSPYPPGLLLPEPEKRPTCAELWPPVIAPEGAQEIGKWSVVKRKDGRNQWAYDGFALYTSALDHQEGDVNGGTKRKTHGDSPADREPVAPPPLLPPQFRIAEQTTGRLLVTSQGASVYALADERPDKILCDTECSRAWTPVLAPALSRPQGAFTVFERLPGIKQWAFHGEPLYTRVGEERQHSLEGADAPGWHNVYTQKAPPPPADFTVQESPGGLVLADSRGRTVYIYHCGDDALDQLACDYPDASQVYRFAVCGGGDPARCLQAFPYVLATPGVKSTSRLWSVLTIDPRTGHTAAPGQADALHVWAFRQRPVFTCALDAKPGDLRADGWGEFNGYRNGFKAFWLRDDFTDNAG
jgi:predicted lipoprotein with Yx(FWY)xxD motif